MKELLEIVEKHSGEIESGEKEMLRKMGMWMPKLPGFRKTSSVCSAFYYSGGITGEREMMLRKMGMWMPEVPCFRKISLFWFLWDGRWSGKG